MPALRKPDVICTHESDLDGLVAGLLLRELARQRYGGDVRLEAYHYQGWKSRPLTENAAWVADFTFEARMDRSDWWVVDHHVTDVVPKSARLDHDVSKSASLLCYDHCRAEGLGTAELDRLIHLTNVGDLFLTDDPDFVLACDYANLVKTYGFWPLYELIEGDPSRLLGHPLIEVMAVKRRVEDPMGFSWARRNVVPVTGEVGYVRSVVGNTNLIVHRLLGEKAVPFPVLMTFFKKGNGQIIVSFRSQNGEALRVARHLQGGGHPNAAGTTLPQNVRDFEAGVHYVRQALQPRGDSGGGGLNSLEAAFAGLKL